MSTLSLLFILGKLSLWQRTVFRALLYYFFQQTFIKGYYMPDTVLGAGDKLDGQK